MSRNSDMPTQDGTSSQLEPPPYNIAAELPTYEEYEQLKKREDETEAVQAEECVLLSDRESLTGDDNADKVIGTDNMFIVGFIFSFLFNWLGLLLSFCVMHTCAGRFGALSGFGLSIVKWVVIVQSNEWTTGMAEKDSWIWWLMMAFGFMICFSGFLHYISIRNKWSRRRYTFAI